MKSQNHNQNINFSVEILKINKDGKKLGKIRPNADGSYTLPAMVINEVTANGTFYDTDSVLDHLLNEKSPFNMRLQDGKLRGEYGHPDLSKYKSDDEIITRLKQIHDDKTATLITKIFIDPKKLPNGGQIVYTNIMPSGPYAQTVQNHLDNPLDNISQSLRTVVDEQWNSRTNVRHRKVLFFTTFDIITAGGGYFKASKRYSPAIESFGSSEFNHGINIPITPEINENVFSKSSDIAGMESLYTNLKDYFINDVVEENNVTLSSTTYNFNISKHKLIDSRGFELNTFHEFERNK